MSLDFYQAPTGGWVAAVEVTWDLFADTVGAGPSQQLEWICEDETPRVDLTDAQGRVTTARLGDWLIRPGGGAALNWVAVSADACRLWFPWIVATNALAAAHDAAHQPAASDGAHQHTPPADLTPWEWVEVARWMRFGLDVSLALLKTGDPYRNFVGEQDDARDLLQKVDARCRR